MLPNKRVFLVNIAVWCSKAPSPFHRKEWGNRRLVVCTAYIVIASHEVLEQATHLPYQLNAMGTHRLQPPPAFHSHLLFLQHILQACVTILTFYLLCT